MTTVEERMQANNVWLPERNPPAATYEPYVRVDNLVFISGQTAKWNADLQFRGKVGEAITMEQAKEAARLCGQNILLQLKLACNGNLDRVVRCIQLRVYVQCADSFKQHPQVANAVSDLMIAVFEDSGKHARAAVGCNSLPSNSPVEVEGVFEVAL